MALQVFHPAPFPFAFVKGCWAFNVGVGLHWLAHQGSSPPSLATETPSAEGAQLPHQVSTSGGSPWLASQVQIL